MQTNKLIPPKGAQSDEAVTPECMQSANVTKFNFLIMSVCVVFLHKMVLLGFIDTNFTRTADSGRLQVFSFVRHQTNLNVILASTILYLDQASVDLVEQITYPVYYTS